MALLQITDFDLAKDDLEFISIINTSTSDTDISRLSKITDTRTGRLKRDGYYPAAAGAAWSSGVSFTDYRQYLIYVGDVYILKDSAVVPVVTSATPSSDFEKLDSIYKYDLNDELNSYNVSNIYKFTDLTFKDLTDMQNLVNIEGETVLAPLGSSLKAAEPITSRSSSYVVIDAVDIQAGDNTILLANGLYAKELEYKLDPKELSPIGKLDRDNDAQNDREANVLTYADANLTAIGNRFATLGQDGKIYWGPGVNGLITSLDPLTLNISTQDVGIAGDWNGGVLGPDGKIYYPPNDTSNADILVFDPKERTYNTIGGFTTPVKKFESGCLAPDGNIYCLGTLDTPFILKINTDTQDFELITRANDPLDTGSNIGWAGLQISSNGKMYAAPKNSRFFIEFDPVTESVVYFGDITSINSDAFSDIALGGDGLLYAIPNTFEYVYKIDPVTLSINSTYLQLGTGTATKTGGACVGPNGKIYTIPSSSGGIKEIDTEKDLIKDIYNLNLGTFRGICQGYNGIIASKSNGGNMMIIKNLNNDDTWTRSAYVAKNS